MRQRGGPAEGLRAAHQNISHRLSPPPSLRPPLSHPHTPPQGRLVRTILFAAEHATANTRDAAIFVSCLLACALAAAAYVLARGLADERRRPAPVAAAAARGLEYVFVMA